MVTNEGYVIAKTTSYGTEPVTFIHGDRSDAESAAGQMPSWFILGTCGYADWRDA